MKNRLFKLLSAVIALTLVLSLSMAVLAEDESEVSTEDTSVVESVDESTAESAEVSDESATSEAESATDSATESTAISETESTATETGTATDTDSGFKHWPRVISLIIVVLLIAVVIILSFTNTKIGQKIAKFFRDYKSEIKKISWYSWKDTWKATAVVLVVIIGLAIAIGILDWLFYQGILGLAGLFN